MQDTVPVRVAGKSCRVGIDVEHVQERLRGLGHSGNLRLEWTQGITPGEYEHEEGGTDVIRLNPHFIILLRMGLIPLPWPTALCSTALFRKRLVQTLAHELRHAQQMAELTGVSEKEPWLSYPVLKWMGRGYILLALVGTIVIQRFLAAEALTPVFVIGGVLIALAAVYIVLAYLNYHLDPWEVDARAYERNDWQTWADCLTLGV